ncbi:hypothetical protein SDC9_113949 [bioreactor metagenome]|jgi:hypothetical protein|uniref:Type II CBASS E2 protein domain-containing protein n=1 Tax=bioreactor metagenome TaxID=1076179 RepID=A0A645BUX4_9ZZZZ
MGMIKNREIPLIVQANKLQSYFPDSKYSVRQNILVWKGYLQPTYLSPKYLIKVVYQREKHPNVYVIDPKPLVLAEGKSKLEHVYDTDKQHLCIYYKRAKEWNETKFIADTIIPWTSEWLFHYEIWATTGIWHGGGIH